MAGELENSLQSLHQCLAGDNQRNFVDAKHSVINIARYFENELSKSELDFAFSTVFAERNGILRFMQVAFPQKTYRTAIQESFVLLIYVVHHFQERVSPYILSIKGTCESCLSQFNTSAYEKEKAVETLRTILQKGPWNQDLEVKKLNGQLMQQACQSKQSPMVLQQLYHTLGVVAHHYPECMASNADKLWRLYRTELDKQIRYPNNRSLIVVTGCLNGLLEYLYTFSPSPEDDPDKKCEKIYSYMKTFTTESTAKRIAQRAALKLLKMHGSLFATHLLAEHRWWHEELLQWLRMPWEDRRIGLSALHTFYREVACKVESSTDDNIKIVLKYFIAFFKGKMLNTSTSPYELGEVIKGFGMFAGSCLTHLKREDVQYMFTLIMQHAEHIYLNFSVKQVGEQDGKRLHNLADHVESIASIVVQLGELAPHQLSSMQHMAVLLVYNFAHVPAKFHYATIEALIALFYSLATSKGVVFEDFLKIIVYQGIVRTCSHPVSIDVELQKDQLRPNSKLITYKNYIPLWLALLNVQSYGKNDMPLAMKQAIVCKVYDTVMQTVILLMGKLDLNTTRRMEDSDDKEFDLDTGLRATTPKDFQVFINLVDTCTDLLPHVDHYMFEKWVQPFSQQLILESARKPLVSGFYKLLTVTFQLCDRIQYFGAMANDDVPEGREALLELVCHFLEEMLARVGHYKGDLQIACLQTFLATPVPLVPRLLHSAPKAFQTVFRVGCCYLRLAELGLTALESWSTSLPPEDMEPILDKVLCHLDSFLQSKGFEGAPEVELELVHVEKGRRRMRCLERRRLVERPETELSSLQRRILRYLGRLDGQTCLALLQQEREEGIRPWGRSTKLKIQLPFFDMRPSIYLEWLHLSLRGRQSYF